MATGEQLIRIKRGDIPAVGDTKESVSQQFERAQKSVRARQRALQGREELLQKHDKGGEIVFPYTSLTEQGQQVQKQIHGVASAFIPTDGSPEGAVKQAHRVKEGLVEGKLPQAKKRIEASIERLTEGVEKGHKDGEMLQEALIGIATAYKQGETMFKQALDNLTESLEKATPQYREAIKKMLDTQSEQFVAWSTQQAANPDLQAGLDLLRERTNTSDEPGAQLIGIGEPLKVPREESKRNGGKKGINGKGSESNYNPPGYLAEIEIDKGRLDALVLLAMQPDTPLRELMEGAISPFTGNPIRGGGVVRALERAIHALHYQYIRADAFADHGETMRPDAREAWETIEEAILQRMGKTREDFKNQTRAGIVQFQVQRLIKNAPRAKDVQVPDKEEVSQKEKLVKQKVAEVAEEAKSHAFSHAEFVTLTSALSMKRDALVSIDGHDVSFKLPDEINELCERVKKTRHTEELPSPEIMRQTRIEAIAKLILLISDVQSDDPFKVTEGTPARQADELRLLRWAWQVNTYGELRDALASILVSDLTQETTQQKDTTHGFVPVATRTRVAARRGEKIEQAPQAEKSTAKEEAKSRIRTPLSEAILMKLVTIMDFSETRSNRDLIDVLGENMLDKNGKLLIPYQLFGALAGEMAYLSGRVYLHNRGKEKNVLTPDEEGAWSVMQGIIADFRTIERRESNPQADAVEPNSITRQEVLLIFNKRLEDIFGEYGYRVTIPSAKKAASHIGDQGKGVSEDITPGITRERAIAVFNLAAEDATPDELQAALNYYESLSDVDMRKFDEAVAQAAEVIKAQTLQEETLSQVAESSGGKAGFPDQEFDVIEVEVTVPPEVVARAKELSFEQTRDYLNRPEAISPEDVEAAVYWYNHVATAQERAALGRSRRVEIVSDVQGEVQEDDSAKARRLRGNDGQLDKHIDELFEEFAKKNFTPQSSLTSGMLQKTFLWGPRMVDGDLAQVLGQSRDSGREYSFWEALALGYVYNYGEGLAPSLKRKFVAKYIELRYAEWLKRRQRRT